MWENYVLNRRNDIKFIQNKMKRRKVNIRKIKLRGKYNGKVKSSGEIKRQRKGKGWKNYKL